MISVGRIMTIKILAHVLEFVLQSSTMKLSIVNFMLKLAT